MPADVVSNTLPYIHEVKRKIDGSGHSIEETVLTVQGATLEECKRIRDDIKKEGA